MISTGDLIFFFSKQMLLRDCQIAQQIAAKPTIWRFTFLGMNCPAQIQNWGKLVGLQSAPTTKAIRLHTYLAK
jgi:hypothetical protein